LAGFSFRLFPPTGVATESEKFRFAKNSMRDATPIERFASTVFLSADACVDRNET
jgi:hypothetical protein